MYIARIFSVRYFLLPIITLTLLLSPPLTVEARSGCCSWHGGVAYCDTSVGTYVCNDGSYSPSCGCSYIPPKPTCIYPNLGESATWEFSANGCNQDIIFSWDKGVLDEFYSIQISKSPGADPGPLSDISERKYTFKDIKPGKWYVNVKPGRSCGWGNIFYWEITVPEVIPKITFEEQIVNEDERKLSYSVSCANSINIIPGIGTVKGYQGTIDIKPKENTLYTLTATNKDQKNTASLSIKYPLPQEKPKQDTLKEDIIQSETNENSSTNTEDILKIISVPAILGLVWLMNKSATKKES